MISEEIMPPANCNGVCVAVLQNMGNIFLMVERIGIALHDATLPYRPR
jgi:hypothetical protein